LVVNIESIHDARSEKHQVIEKFVESSKVSDCNQLSDSFQSWLEHWLKFIVSFQGARLDSIGMEATTISSHNIIGRYSLLAERLRLYNSNIWRYLPINYN